MLVFMLIYTNADCNLALKSSNLFCLIYSISENIFCSFKIHCLFFCKMRIFRSFWIISVTKATTIPDYYCISKKIMRMLLKSHIFLVHTEKYTTFCVLHFCLLCFMRNYFEHLFIFFSFLFSSLSRSLCHKTYMMSIVWWS